MDGGGCAEKVGVEEGKAEEVGEGHEPHLSCASGGKGVPIGYLPEPAGWGATSL